MAAMHKRHHHSYGIPSSTRRSSTSSSPTSSSSDDDMITPCPSPQAESRRTQEQTTSAQEPLPRPTSWRAQSPHLNALDSDDTDPTVLWRTMLAIQRTFGCYNSARMRAAAEMDEDLLPVPSKTCLDLLNDSIASLPEDAKRQLDDFLNHQSESRRSSSSSWKQRLMHGPA